MVKGFILPSLIAFTMLQAETRTITTSIVTEISVSNIYVSILGRSPTREGLDYWGNTGLSNNDIASSFLEQPETEEKYPKGLSPEDLIQNTYKNLFGRGVDTEGFEYWHAQFTSVSSYSMSMFIMSVSNGAIGDDAKIVNNRNSVALAFAKSGNKDIKKAKEIVEETTASEASIVNVIQKYSLQETYVQITESYQLQVEKDAKLAIADPAKAAAEAAAKAKIEADKATAAAKIKADEAAKKAATEAAAAKVKADEATAAAAVVVAAPAAPAAPTLARPILNAPSAQEYTINTAITELPISNTGGAIASCTVTPALPSGLTLNTSTCAISGTPTGSAVASATYTVRATNATGSAEVGVVILVKAADTTAPVITLIGNLSITLEYGETYTDQGANVVDTIDGNSIITSGTLVGSADSNHTITYNVSDTAGNAATEVTRTVIVNPLAIPVLGNVAAQTYYKNSAITSLVIPNTGGAYISSCTSTPNLPNNLVLTDSNATNCILSGTPDANSTATNYSIVATNSAGGVSAPLTLNITVNNPSATDLQTPADQNLTVGLAMTQLSIINNGGGISSCTPNPSLPNGLSINSATCAISGTPDSVQSATDYNITAVGADGNSSTILNIEVHATPPAVSLPILASASGDINATVGTPITAITFSPSGGAITSCDLNETITGLDVNSTTCEITGTPTGSAVASADYIVTAHNSAGDANSTVNITVNATTSGTGNAVTQSDLDTRLQTLFGITGTTIESNLTDANTTAQVVFTGFVDTNGSYAYHIVGWDNDNDDEHNTSENNGTLSAFVSTSLGNQVKYISNKDENSTDSFEFYISNNDSDVNSSNFTVEINATVIAVVDNSSNNAPDINETVLTDLINGFDHNTTLTDANTTNKQEITLGGDYNASYTYHIVGWNDSGDNNTSGNAGFLSDFNSTHGTVNFTSYNNVDVNSTFEYFISANVNSTDVNSSNVTANVIAKATNIPVTLTQTDLNATIDTNNSARIDGLTIKIDAADRNSTNPLTIQLGDTNSSYTYHIVDWNGTGTHDINDANATLSNFSSSDGNLTYTSNVVDTNRTDSFEFFISDNNSDTNSSNYTVDINSTNTVVMPVYLTTAELDAHILSMRGADANDSNVFDANITNEGNVFLGGGTADDTNGTYTYHIVNTIVGSSSGDYNLTGYDNNSSNDIISIANTTPIRGNVYYFQDANDRNHTVTIEYFINANDEDNASSSNFTFEINSTI